MFGMGGSEMLLILIVALLFLGPEKLPDAASKISKGIRDIRKQTRELTQTIENDTEIGGAIRDIKSALRGEDIKPRVTAKPPLKKKKKPRLAAVPDDLNRDEAVAPPPPGPPPPPPPSEDVAEAKPPEPPKVRLPDTAGEPAPGDEDRPAAHVDDDGELAKLVRAPADTVAKGDAG